jgi:hypothetical protein
MTPYLAATRPAFAAATPPPHGFGAPTALAQLLLGLQRDPAARGVQVGPHLLQRVHIVIIERDPSAADDADDETDDALAPEPIPPLARTRLLAPPRLVQGELLRADDGRLFERIGTRLRPLQSLASGPRGEVLEIAPAPDREATRSAPAPTLASQPPPPAPPPAATPPAARALFPSPGQWRLLTLGEARPLLAPQLREPGRLRDNHRLPCHVEIFESGRDQPVSDFAAAVDALAPTHTAARCVALTPPLAALLKLELPETANNALAPAAPGRVRAGDRVARVTLAFDPTAQPLPSPTPPPAPHPVPAAAPTREPAPVAPPAARDAVPAAFAQTGALRSREEALLQFARPDSGWSRLRRRFTSGVNTEDLRAWQVRLSGRTADEQLWAVAPPTGWRHDPAIRAWAEQSLALAGYALPAMSREWELHWLRREP